MNDHDEYIPPVPVEPLELAGDELERYHEIRRLRRIFDSSGDRRAPASADEIQRIGCTVEPGGEEHDKFLAGDLSLRFLLEASASGLLHSLQPDPFERHDMLHLRHSLLFQRKERYMRYSQREWITSLVTQICMAIGNRDRYKSANEDMMRLLEYLRDLDLPDNENVKASSAYDDIMALWRRVFGDPEEFERKQAEQNGTSGLVESREAQLAREREEHVRRNLFR